jgi:hypothetical protein
MTHSAQPGQSAIPIELYLPRQLEEQQLKEDGAYAYVLAKILKSERWVRGGGK